MDKQARTSSEDAQAAGYAQFEKVWVGQGCATCCSLAAGLRGNGERMRKWRENEEIERRWRENEEMDRE